MSSHHVTAWIMDNSEARGGDRLVLLALASHCGNDEWQCFPSVQRIARFVRMSERGTQYALRSLEKEGRIVKAGRGPKGTTAYQIRTDSPADFAGVQNLQGANDGSEGVQMDARKVQQIAPELEGTGKELEREHAGATFRILPEWAVPLAGIEQTASRKFESAWMEDRAKVVHSLSAESEAVAALVVAKLVDAAPRWEARSVAYYVDSAFIPEARKMAERNAAQATPGAHLFGDRPLTADQRLQQRNRQRLSAQGIDYA